MTVEYPGSAITRDDSWMIELAHIPEDMRREESALTASRWFDYRHLLPAQATYLFASRYEFVYRAYYAQMRDRNTADTVKVFLNPDVFMGADMIPFWRARQDADRLGCKYDFYLRSIFQRCWDRGWRYMPRPNQLYSEEITLDLKDAWRARKLDLLELAESPWFRLPHYCGHPDQDAYHDYLIEQVKGRAHPYLTLSRLIHKEEMLPLELAGKHFDPGTISRAFIFHNT